MRLESTSKQAGELVAYAMEDIATFRQTKQRKFLQEAADKLAQARVEDRDYLPGLYARALVDDLDGRAADAIGEFRQVLAEEPPFADEAEYHLGVALYHRYNWPSLDEAITHLSAVLARTGDPLLACRARVKLIQALGMRMVPRDPREADLEQIRAYFHRLQEEAIVVERSLRAIPDDQKQMLSELRAALHNAKGLATMYWSDFFGNRGEKIARLEDALSEFERADQHDPEHWATYCDIGSTWMRLGYWKQSDSAFTQALQHLDRVVERLRPHYGFAIYEMGRTCRLAGRFQEALRHFERAMQIPYEYRDVSDRRIVLESRRAQASSTEYP